MNSNLFRLCALAALLLRRHTAAALAPAAGARAMQSINKVILRSPFMALFFGSTLLYAVLIAVTVFDTDLDGRGLLFATGLIYVVGMFLCTALANVPLNNRLAAAGDDVCTKAETWPHYFKHWTRWNHLRSVCSLATLALSIHYLVCYT